MTKIKNRDSIKLASTDASEPGLFVGLRPAGLNEIETSVLQRLVDAIMQRRLAPGMKLNEEELAQIFSVSRERIRRILLVLSQHGIVSLEPNRGASVASPSGTERREVIQARCLLESHVVTVLAGLDPARRRTIVTELRPHLEDERAAVLSDDRGLQVRLSGEFHLKLAARAGNREILRMVQDTVARMSLSLAAQAHSHKLDCSICEHALLLDAIEAGDVDQATQLMHGHLGQIEEDIEISLAGVSALQRALTGGR